MRTPERKAQGRHRGAELEGRQQAAGIDEGELEADVQVVWDPPWNQNMISEAGRIKLGMI